MVRQPPSRFVLFHLLASADQTYLMTDIIFICEVISRVLFMGFDLRMSVHGQDNNCVAELRVAINLRLLTDLTTVSETGACPWSLCSCPE
jgi:hypothetical protein